MQQKYAVETKPEKLGKIKISLFQRISFRMGTTFMVFSIPFLLMLFFFIDSRNLAIDFAQKEIYGVEYNDPLRKLVSLVPERKLLMQRYIFGEKDIVAEISKVDEKIKAVLLEMNKIDAKYNRILGVSAQYSNIAGDYYALYAKGLEINIITSNRKHGELTSELMNLIKLVGDKSNLILDQELDSYYLMDLSVVRLPDLLLTLGEFKQKVYLFLKDGVQTADARADIATLRYKLDNLLKDINYSIDVAYKYNESNDVKSALAMPLSGFDKNLKELFKFVDINVLSDLRANVTPDEFVGKLNTVNEAAAKLYDKVNPELLKLLNNRIHALEKERNLQVFIALLCVLATLVLVFSIVRGISGSLQEVVASFIDIGDGKYKEQIKVDRKDEIGRVQRSLVDMREQLLSRLRRDKIIANTNLRIRQALDNSSTSALVLDVHGKIVYLNLAMFNLFKAAKADLTRAVAGFELDSLVGSNFEMFYVSSAALKGMIEIAAPSSTTELSLGEKIFRLTFNPIKNAKQERIGTVIEWKDRTQEIAIEKEIDGIVLSAAQGNLSSRVDLHGKTGFQLKLSEGLNSLVVTFEKIITDMVASLEALARGNLTRKIENEYEGEYRVLKQDTNATLDKLVEIITKISQSSKHITKAATEISKGNSSLSQRTESQATSLEETALSMNKMTSSVKSNLDSINNATELVNNAKGKAKQGGTVVLEAIKAMEDIDSSSKRISSIIGVIDEIAFQTNILALNAAVEAARAGEQGKGFAVVASEVRNLSQRTAQAAKEVKDLITDSVHKVSKGTGLVEKSGAHLESIIEAVDKVTQITEYISNAAKEQTGGIEQVNQAVSEMDKMTQQNAALVEQVAGAGESMYAQASSLMKLVSFFSLDKEEQASQTSSNLSSEVDLANNFAANKQAANHKKGNEESGNTKAG